MKNSLIQLLPLTKEDELAYKKMLLDSQVWKFNPSRDPEWKKELFTTEFEHYCTQFNVSGSKVVKIGNSLKGEIVFNKNKKQIFLTAKANLEHPLLKKKIIRLLKIKKIKDLREVPRMVARFFKILPGWL